MLKGKVALVSESSYGIGASIAKRFASEGAHVLLVSEDASGLAKTYDEIKKNGGEATLTQTDICKIRSVEELCISINSLFRRLDILVGGAFHFGSINLLVDYTEEKWLNVLNMNLHNNWRLLKIFDPLLKSANAGRVIMSTCDYKETNNSFCGAHIISELALKKMVEIYAAETNHTNIRANLVTLDSASLIENTKDLDEELINKITNTFIKLSLDKCKFTGKSHYAQY